MKTRSSLFIVCFFLWIGHTSITSNKKLVVEKVNLLDAIAKKWILVEAKSTGKYGENSVQLSIKNLRATPISLIVNAGLVFDVENPDEQDMFVAEDKLLALNGNGKLDQTIHGFCTNSHGKVPKTDEKMTPKLFSSHPQMKQVTDFLKGKKLASHVIQDAVWSLTNDEPVNHIPSDAPENKELKKILYAITKQKESWYEAPQTHQVMPDRSINRETVSISGDFKFPGKKGMFVTEELCNEAGTVLYKLQEMEIKHDTDEVSYRFNIQVKGWKKGNYFVRIKTGGTILKKYDFTV